MSKSAQIKKIIKRDGSIVTFQLDKIAHAAYRAMLSAKEGSHSAAETVAQKVLQQLTKKHNQDKKYIPTVEEIQDILEQKLILSGFANTAKAFILYRHQHQQLRQKSLLINDRIRQLAEQSSQYFRNPLSEVIYLRTYARWIEQESRRETWIETIERFMSFMREKLKHKLSEKLYHDIHQAILNQEIIPSMRLMQFAGKAARSTNVCAYNCSYIAPECLADFGEIMYISMCGCGVGFSVESQNIQKLPIIKKQTGKTLKTHVVEDSKEEWCRAFVIGLETWFNGNDIEFDYSKLRPLGAPLKTFGGKSSGPDPLHALLDYSRAKILNKQGRRLSNLEAYDILCKIGEIVVSGGVRRSAMISLSDLDDIEMRDAKKGPFYYSQPQRSFANNSTVYDLKPNDETLIEEWMALIKSQSGERGIFNRGDLIHSLPKRRVDYFRKKGIIRNNSVIGMIGTNPCGEILLQSKQFCNLTEVIARPNDTEQTLLRKIRLAAIVGTYQATLTKFPYLSKAWERHCKEEALLGVSITGQWDCPRLQKPAILQHLKKEAIQVNKRYAKRFNINPATSVTCVKPSGTASLVVDSAAGIHPRFAEYYIRRVRISATDALFQLLKDQGVPYHPEVGYTENNTPTFVLDFPVAAPKRSVLRNDLSAIDQLEHWKMVKQNYTEHNPSVTISVDENEWIPVLNWLKKHWNVIGGLSFLPRHNEVYQLMPFEEISEQEYLKLADIYHNLDFSKLSAYEKRSEDDGNETPTQLGPACE